ncbi:MAG TPA: AraC family transcriptional regulator [Trichocoleus sp.]
MSPRFVSTPEEVEQVFTAPPLATTGGFHWHGLHVDCRWEPPSEVAEVCAPWHVAIMFTQLPVPCKAERRLDGRLRQEPVHTGDLVVIPAYAGHGSVWDKPGEFVTFVFEPSIFARTIDEAADADQVSLKPCFATSDPLVLQLALTFKQLLQQPNSNRLYAETLAHTLAVHLIHHHATHQPRFRFYSGGLSAAQLRQVIDYIQAHLEQDLGLSELAALLPMSPHYFAQLFKQSTGFSPHQYILQCRVKRAKELLHHTRQPIADIAFQVGFSHQSHLNRHFKRLIGVTPKQFRLSQ